MFLRLQTSSILGLSSFAVPVFASFSFNLLSTIFLNLIYCIMVATNKLLYNLHFYFVSFFIWCYNYIFITVFGYSIFCPPFFNNCVINSIRRFPPILFVLLLILHFSIISTTVLFLGSSSRRMCIVLALLLLFSFQVYCYDFPYFTLSLFY